MSELTRAPHFYGTSSAPDYRRETITLEQEIKEAAVRFSW